MSASHKALRPRPLVLALSSLMLVSLPAFAQESAPTTLQEVKVTGSRIPRASVEGPSPVTVISREQIDAQGYRNAFDALSALTENTGNVQARTSAIRSRRPPTPSTCVDWVRTARWCWSTAAARPTTRWPTRAR